MSRKEFYCLVDTETTIKQQVCDIGIIVTDRKGEIYQEKGFLLPPYANQDLFYCEDSFFSKKNLPKRYSNYEAMLEGGKREKVTIRALNSYLENIVKFYNPYLTAYNLAFDMRVSKNTEINLEIFPKRFCLWHLAVELWARTRNYKQFIIQNHLFNSPTQYRNMSYKTNCEVMSYFLTGQDVIEPHTALEDVKFFELPILLKAVNKRGWKKNLHKPFNWKEFQVKDHFCEMMVAAIPNEEKI